MLDDASIGVDKSVDKSVDQFISPTFFGKNVAIIGPAPHITKTRRPEITAMDYVVRVNQALPVPPEVAEMTTKRCDVLYTIAETPPNSSWDQVKEIRMRAHNVWGMPNQRLRNVFAPLREKLHILPPRYTWELWEEVGGRPNTGFAAILNILSEKPASLRIYGFTFHQGDVYASYYKERKGPGLQRIIDNNGAVDKHNPKEQLAYFAEHVFPLENVWTDEVLTELCNRTLEELSWNPGGVLSPYA